MLAQEYPDLEYWVIDGGSTDGTLDVLNSYRGQINLITEPDSGQSDAINKGLRRAIGSILSWINSNDIYLPGAFMRVAETFGGSPETGLVFGRALLIGEEGEKLGPYNSVPPEEMEKLNALPDGHFRKLLHTDSGWIPQQTTFWRASTMHQAGMLDPTLHYAMDYEYWLRLGKVSRIRFLDASLGAFRLHADAKSRSAWPQWKEVLAVNRRYGGPLFSGIHRKFAAAAAGALVRRTRRIIGA